MKIILLLALLTRLDGSVLESSQRGSAHVRANEGASVVGTAEACDCASQLAALTAATRLNYAGYTDKTEKAADSLAMARHVELLMVQARRTPGSECLPILRSYIRFFRDGHLQVRSSAATTPAPPVALEAVLPADAANSADDRTDPILGYWESPSGRSRIHIARAPAPFGSRDRMAINIFSPDTLWRSGDVRATFVLDSGKFVYHAKWFSPRRPPQDWAAVVVDDTLLLTGFDGWFRVRAEQPPAARARRDPLRPSFRALSPTTGLLTLPSMQVQYAADVDSIVREHGSDIGRLELLVIDVRGNQGGGDGTYMPLLPLLYTDTIVTSSGSVLSSPANIAYYERYLDPAGVNSPAWVVEMLAEMRQRPGAHIPLPDSKLAYGRVPSQPQRVAILIDAVGASSTETFLLKARQSAKVRLFGQPTAGIVDYLNPAQHTLSCGFVLQAPTIRRTVTLPAGGVDNVGVQPDVVLSPGVNAVQRLLASFGMTR